MAKTLVIIPTYNEQETIVGLVNQLLALGIGLDILIVDDGDDKTAELIKQKQKTQPNLFLIKREKKSGRGSAVLAGIKSGLEKGYDFLVEMDADFSHQPQELLGLLAAAGPNRVVIASRYLKDSEIKNWPLKRTILSRCANFYANLVLGIGIHDYTNGYRVYGKAAAEKIEPEKIKAVGYIVLSEIAYQLFKKGVEFCEVKTLFINRQRGVSSLSLKELKESFLSVLRIKKSYK